MQSEKVIVLGDQDAPGCCGELEVGHIGRADYSSIRRGSYVHIPPPETIGDLSRNVFVKMKADRHQASPERLIWLAQ